MLCFRRLFYNYLERIRTKKEEEEENNSQLMHSCCTHFPHYCRKRDGRASWANCERTVIIQHDRDGGAERKREWVCMTKMFCWLFDWREYMRIPEIRFNCIHRWWLFNSIVFYILYFFIIFSYLFYSFMQLYSEYIKLLTE